jgi:sugar lactone lactonase YvrE
MGTAISGNPHLNRERSLISFYPRLIESFLTKCVTFWLLWCATDIAGAQSFNFSTLAGNAGYGSVDGSAANARFDFPTGVAVDASGVIYIADTQNSTVRTIDTSGNVQTLAGLAGHIGATNGAGPAARFKYPQGIASDSAGNIYVADTGNSIIRRINVAADVSTIAGSPGVVGSSNGINSAASFNLPCGIAVDPSGNLYVADTYNNIIRQIALIGTNWVVSTVVGSPGVIGSSDGINAIARFSQPLAMTVGNDGNLYVADTGNNSIRKIVRFGTNWVTTTLTNVSLPGGIAADTAGNLFVADSANDVIRKLTPAGGTWAVNIFAGAPGISGSTDGTTTARFNFPRGIAMDANAILFVADSFNNTIRQITPAGAVSTVAGTAGGTGSSDGSSTQARFDAPLGIAVDNVRNVYVADSKNNTIRQISPLGSVTTLAGSPTNLAGSIDGWITNATFNLPSALALDSNTNVYVADFFNNEIRRVSPVGAAWKVTTLAGRPGAVFHAAITNFGGFIANVFDSLTNLSSIVFSTKQNYTNFSGVLTNISNGKTNLTFVVTNTPTFTNIVRRQTNIIVLASNWFVLPTLSVSTVFSSSATFKNYSGALTNVTGGNTNITLVVTNVPFLTNVVNGKTQAVSLVTNFFTLPAAPQALDGLGTNALFYHPSGLALDSDGNLYVADGGSNGVRVIDPEGAVTTLAGSVGMYTLGNSMSTHAYSSSAVALDPAGNVFVTDTENNVIRKITPEGSAITIVGTPGFYGTADGTNSAARFASPNSIAIDAQTNLYLSDGLNHTLRKIFRSGTNWVVTTIAGKAPISGDLDGPDTTALFNNPGGIALDSSGNLYVADTDNNTIRFGQRVATSGPVALQISQSAGQILIRWPASAADFVLQTRSAIGPENPWLPVANIPVATGSDMVVTLNINGPAAYYRLRKP